MRVGSQQLEALNSFMDNLDSFAEPRMTVTKTTETIFEALQFRVGKLLKVDADGLLPSWVPYSPLIQCDCSAIAAEAGGSPRPLAGKVARGRLAH
jgi:hypothetical protein